MEIILDALDEWENKDSELLDMIDSLKQIPEPNRESQPLVHDVFCDFRSRMLGQERKAKETKRNRRNQAIMVKAKLLLFTQQLAAAQMVKDALENDH